MLRRNRCRNRKAYVAFYFLRQISVYLCLCRIRRILNYCLAIAFRTLDCIIPGKKINQSGIEEPCEFLHQFPFVIYQSGITDQATQLGFSTGCIPGDALADIVRRIQRHHLAGADDIDFLRFSFPDGHGKTAAGVLERSKLSDGRRPVSGDIAAASERKIKALLDVPAAYALGASGDQWQILRAVEDGLDAQGKQYKVDHMEQGFDFVEILGARLAQSVMRALSSVEHIGQNPDPKLYTRTVTLPAHKELPPPQAMKITRSVTFEPVPDVQMEYHVFCLGDIAIVCCKPEVCVKTLQEIRENSPFSHTILLEFTNNHANYMVTRDLYEKCAPQSRKGYFAAGAAELFSKDVSEFLHKLYELRKKT